MHELVREKRELRGPYVKWRIVKMHFIALLDLLNEPWSIYYFFNSLFPGISERGRHR